MLCQDIKNHCQRIQTLQKELSSASEEAKDLNPEKLLRAWKAKLALEKEKEQLENLLVPKTISAQWKNPETGETKEIAIHFQKELERFRKLYQEQLGISLDEKEMRSIWRRNKKDIKEAMEQYGYDQILLLPDNLPNKETLNRDLIETMEEPGKGKVNATWQNSNFKDGGSFAGVKTPNPPKAEIRLVHSDQNIYQNEKANPFLKATLGKNIMQVSSLIKAEIERRIQANEEIPVNFETEIKGKKIQIQAEGLSLKAYQIFQRIYFEKTGKHLDEKGWIWLPGSFSGSRVVNSDWDPDDRQLYVYVHDPVSSSGALGLRLSRSFS